MCNFWVPFTHSVRGKGINGFTKLTDTGFKTRVITVKIIALNLPLLSSNIGAVYY